MIGIGIFGGGGRMGRAIADAVAGRDDIRVVEDRPDIFVDFSAPEALPQHLDAAVAAGKPILIGTTGLTGDHQRLIDEVSAHIAVLQAANTSLGVTLLARLVREAAARLGEGWDIEILEMHHRHKVDAPSGTSLLLGRAAAEGRGIALEPVIERAGGRRSGEIGFAVMRGGSVAGDHHIVFAGDGERIELGHRAESRAIFAQGAVRAALWLAGKPAGRYAMDDVLGLK